MPDENLSLYAHPDGGEVCFRVDKNRLAISEPDDEAVAGVPIGPVGLKALACSLLALAMELEASHV